MADYRRHFRELCSIGQFTVGLKFEFCQSRPNVGAVQGLNGLDARCTAGIAVQGHDPVNASLIYACNSGLIEVTRQRDNAAANSEDVTG